MKPLAYNYLGEAVFSDELNKRHAGKSLKNLTPFEGVNPARFLLIDPQNQESSWLCALAFALQQGQRSIQIDEFYKLCSEHLSKAEHTECIERFIVDSLHSFYRFSANHLNAADITLEKINTVIGNFKQLGLQKALAKIPKLMSNAHPIQVIAARYCYAKNPARSLLIENPYFDPLDGERSVYTTDSEQHLPWSISPLSNLSRCKQLLAPMTFTTVLTIMSGENITLEFQGTKEELSVNDLCKAYASTADAPIGATGRHPYQPLNNILPASSSLSTSLMLAHKKFASTLPPGQDWLRYVSNITTCPSPEKVFSSEQMDAISIATINFQERKSFILADETGLGKGRILAGLARAFISKGKNVTFITEKKHLFSDFWRDILAVSEGAPTIQEPFILHPHGKIFAPSGEVIAKSLPAKKFKEIVGSKKSPSSLVFTTYSQFNRDAKHSDKHQMLIEHLRDGLLILDESHNASGQSQTRTNIHSFIEATSKCVFSSATYAKHEQAFELYATATPLTKNEMALLISSFQSGDTIAASNSIAHGLVSIGSMVRREHMPDENQQSIIIRPEASKNDTMLQHRHSLHKCLEDIFFLQETIDIQKKKNGEDTTATWMTLGGTLSRLSKQFNVLSKIKLASLTACDLFSKGFKPVIAMESTFEAFQKAKIHWLKTNSISINEDDFEDDNDEVSEMTYSKSEFSIGALFALAIESIAPQVLINKLGGTALQHAKATALKSCECMPEWLASPIDYLLKEFNSVGLNVGEISGRTMRFIDDGNGNVRLAALPPPDREKTVGSFNNGTIDALILTQAGASGISVHASETFADQRRRAFIELEICSNPTQRQQFLGRVRRKGQVSQPAYYVITSGNPYEHRLIERANDKHMLLAGLTSASQDSATGALLIGQKIMSELGDAICLEWLESNIQFSKRLGIFPSAREQGSFSYIEKTLKRISLLPSDKQDELFDFLLKGCNLVRTKPLEENNKAYVIFPVLAKSAPIWGPASIIATTSKPSPFEPSVFAQEWCCHTAQGHISSAEFNKIISNNDNEKAIVALAQLRPKALKALRATRHQSHARNLSNLADIAIHLAIGSKIRISHPHTGRAIDGVVTNILPPENENWLTFPSQWGIQAHFPSQPFIIYTSLLSFFSDPNAYITRSPLPPDTAWDKQVAKPLHFTTIDGHCGYSKWYANHIGRCITQKFSDSSLELHELPALVQQTTISELLDKKIPLIDPRLTLQLIQRDTQLTLTTNPDDNTTISKKSLIPVAGGWLLTIPKIEHDVIIDFTLEKRIGPRKYFTEDGVEYVARFVSITNIHAVVTMLHHRNCRFYCPASRKKWHATALEMLLVSAKPVKAKAKGRK